MSPFRRIWNVIRRRRLDDELRQEVDTHLAFIEDEERANGVSQDGARRQARVRFGSLPGHRERALDGVIATSLESAWKEIVFALRRLLRSPAFTVAAVLTLALAIGANAAIFAVVERVLLNPLPYPESDRLIDVTHTATRLSLGPTMGITRGYYFLYRERAHTLEGIALYDTIGATLTGDGDPQRIRVTRATTSFASVMRVWPAVGRWFTEEEDRPGAPPRVVLSYGLWMRRYGGDQGIIGKPISLSGVSTEIVGVMPQSFAFPDATVDAWTMGQVTREMGFGIWLYNAVARLRDGVSVDDARRELNALVPDVVRAFPGDAFARPTLLSSASCRCQGRSRRRWSATSRGLSGSCSRPSVSSCSSLARTSPTCSSCGPRRASASWPFASRSAPEGQASPDTSWPKACCCRSREPSSGSPSHGAPCNCSSRLVRRRSRGLVRYGWTASSSPIPSL